MFKRILIIGCLFSSHFALPADHPPLLIEPPKDKDQNTRHEQDRKRGQDRSEQERKQDHSDSNGRQQSRAQQQFSREDLEEFSRTMGRLAGIQQKAATAELEDTVSEELLLERARREARVIAERTKTVKEGLEKDSKTRIADAKEEAELLSAVEAVALQQDAANDANVELTAARAAKDKRKIQKRLDSEAAVELAVLEREAADDADVKLTAARAAKDERDIRKELARQAAVESATIEHQTAPETAAIRTKKIEIAEQSGAIQAAQHRSYTQHSKGPLKERLKDAAEQGVITGVAQGVGTFAATVLIEAATKVASKYSAWYDRSNATDEENESEVRKKEWLVKAKAVARQLEEQKNKATLLTLQMALLEEQEKTKETERVFAHKQAQYQAKLAQEKREEEIATRTTPVPTTSDIEQKMFTKQPDIKQPAPKKFEN